MAKPGDDFDGANVSPSGLPQPDKLSAMIGSDRIGSAAMRSPSAPWRRWLRRPVDSDGLHHQPVGSDIPGGAYFLAPLLGLCFLGFAPGGVAQTTFVGTLDTGSDTTLIMTTPQGAITPRSSEPGATRTGTSCAA